MDRLVQKQKYLKQLVLLLYCQRFDDIKFSLLHCISSHFFCFTSPVGSPTSIWADSCSRQLKITCSLTGLVTVWLGGTECALLLLGSWGPSSFWDTNSLRCHSGQRWNCIIAFIGKKQLNFLWGHLTICMFQNANLENSQQQ